jgi:restriction system protein
MESGFWTSIKHEVGVKRRPVEIYEIDEAFFAERFGVEEDDEGATSPDDGNNPA